MELILIPHYHLNLLMDEEQLGRLSRLQILEAELGEIGSVTQPLGSSICSAENGIKTSHQSTVENVS